jgi:hypothetical protein
MSELSNEQVGAIAAMISKSRETVAQEYLEGYDAKIKEMAEKREEKAARMAEYNRLAALGMSDAEIEKAMKDV